MEKIEFIDEHGSFRVNQPEQSSYLYFPLASEMGMKSAVTPQLGGDCKEDQNHFLLEPVSAENLHNNRSTRNFWCRIKEQGVWSATGVSAAQRTESAETEESFLEAGFMWHKMTRTSNQYHLQSEITNFVPRQANVELMKVKLTNIGDTDVTFTPIAAIPIYGRSADNIRDHRHVTSLLHQITTIPEGVVVIPTLSFDERGHKVNDTVYYVTGYEENGKLPKKFHPVVEDFIGEGGSFDHPEGVYGQAQGQPFGVTLKGLEAVGGIEFDEVTLASGTSCTYILHLGFLREDLVDQKLPAFDCIHKHIKDGINVYKTLENVDNELENTKNYWKKNVNVSYHTSSREFDQFMKWVSFQPILRRLFGCSFLPHHDYGKGGRGWRDLWQDCLALLIMNPNGVRQMLIDNFAGVRIDGTNATIIGEKQGTFIADRNHITRVWMDHGMWPFMTTFFYLKQTGDRELLFQEAAYFKDPQVMRGTDTDREWRESEGSWLLDEKKQIYQGTILEHILVQHLTAFYEVGSHNIMRLRGADWNDALDMAEENGESVAFTNAYAGNLSDLSYVLMDLYEKGHETVFLAKEIGLLLEEDNYEDVNEKKKVLETYGKSVIRHISGEKIAVDTKALSKNLLGKAQWIKEHISKQEWVEDGKGNGWFNGYYDNHQRGVEGVFEDGNVRMMLTSQVFAIMGGTATEEQISAIIKSADQYLYDENAGGYRLNTDFKELKTDLGRMFGFSYGDKENGAVFSHMAVMYGNALYKRGYAKEGYKVLKALQRQSDNTKVSQIYPGIPEYFNARGRGMYHYLTGAASWYMLTVITEMFGVKGDYGDLTFVPKLMKEQFDHQGKASICLTFSQVPFRITYRNEKGLTYGDYQVKNITLDGHLISDKVITKEMIRELSKEKTYEIDVTLQ